MHRSLEQYLTELSGKLSGLPEKRKAEELREMRGHLQTAKVSSVQQGQSEDEAAASAISQFGTPETVAQKTAEAWKRGRALDLRGMWSAAGCSLGLTFVIMLIPNLLTLHTVYTNARQFLISQLSEDMLLFLLIAAAGAMTGYLFPRRTVSGALIAMALWCLLISPCIAGAFSHIHHGPRILFALNHKSMGTLELAELVPYAFEIVFLVAICVVAFSMGELRKRKAVLWAFLIGLAPYTAMVLIFIILHGIHIGSSTTPTSVWLFITSAVQCSTSVAPVMLAAVWAAGKIRESRNRSLTLVRI